MSRMPNAMLLLAALALCAAAPARAAAIDGTQVLVCASLHTFDCSAGGTCVESTAEGVNMADLLEVDPKGKKLTALDNDHRGQASEIVEAKEAEGRLVLSGVDGARGWKLAIQEESGDSVLTVSDSSIAIVIYGECALK